MNIVKLKNCPKDVPIVLALGFFDSVHSAHRHLISICKNLSFDLNANSAIFTFDNNPKEFFLKTQEKLLYDFETRCDILGSLGLDYLLYETFDNDFASLDKNDFLQLLNALNVKAIVCGFDYTFGKNALGTSGDLHEYCLKNDIKLHIVPKISYVQQKVSTSYISQLIKDGDLQKANTLLGESYRYTSVVTNGYAVGRNIGFATANLALKKDIVSLKTGVYAGYCTVFEKKYKAIINVGNRLTFNDFENKIEAHLIDFEGDLYGKKITIHFEKFLRNQIRFDSIEELSSQLTKDKIDAELVLL